MHTGRSGHGTGFSDCICGSLLVTDRRLTAGLDLENDATAANSQLANPLLQGSQPGSAGKLPALPAQQAASSAVDHPVGQMQQQGSQHQQYYQQVPQQSAHSRQARAQGQPDQLPQCLARQQQQQQEAHHQQQANQQQQQHQVQVKGQAEPQAGRHGLAPKSCVTPSQMMIPRAGIFYCSSFCAVSGLPKHSESIAAFPCRSGSVKCLTMSNLCQIILCQFVLACVLGSAAAGYNSVKHNLKSRGIGVLGGGHCQLTEVMQAACVQLVFAATYTSVVTAGPRAGLKPGKLSFQHSIPVLSTLRLQAYCPSLLEKLLVQRCCMQPYYSTRPMLALLGCTREGGCRSRLPCQQLQGIYPPSTMPL